MQLKMRGKTTSEKINPAKNRGFTLVEVIVAASLMIVLCISLLSVLNYVIKVNRGENLRMQALSVLQQEIEHYRSLKFVPGNETTADLNTYRPAELQAGTHTRPARTSADGRVFNISVTVTNSASPSAAEHLCRFKEITITATPQVAETSWLANLRTNVTIQRVRTN